MREAVSKQSSAISQKIRKNFSKAAINYDNLAVLQQTIGSRFLFQLKDEIPQRTLDIGMGTGWLTQRLCEQFKDSRIVGIDFSDGMIARARNKKERFRILQAEAANLPFVSESFDLIVSNLMYQWVEDLKKSFGEARRTLKEHGSFYLSTFGPQTLHELFASIEKSSNGRQLKLSNAVLPSKEKITDALLHNGFRDFHVTSEIFKVYFSNVTSLLRWLKNIGANTTQKNVFLGKEMLLKADDFYHKSFLDEKGIFASFEVVWAKAKK